MAVIDRVMSIQNQYLVRAYGLEELSGNAIDRSVNRQDGTVISATQNGGRTPYGTPCYDFDGSNDQVDCDTGASDLDSWHSGTIIALFNSDDVTAAGIYDIVAIRSASSDNSVEMRRINDDMQYSIKFNNSSDDTYQGNVLSINTWFTCAISWQDNDGDGNIYYYLDGSQLDSDTTTASWNTDTVDECKIGTSFWGGAQFWTGFIGPVLMWKGVRLTTAEINLASRLLRRV